VTRQRPNRTPLSSLSDLHTPIVIAPLPAPTLFPQLVHARLDPIRTKSQTTQLDMSIASKSRRTVPLFSSKELCGNNEILDNDGLMGYVVTASLRLYGV
jgi:hypothetical protein